MLPDHREAHSRTQSASTGGGQFEDTFCLGRPQKPTVKEEPEQERRTECSISLFTGCPLQLLKRLLAGVVIVSYNGRRPGTLSTLVRYSSCLLLISQKCIPVVLFLNFTRTHWTLMSSHEMDLIDRTSICAGSAMSPWYNCVLCPSYCHSIVWYQRCHEVQSGVKARKFTVMYLCLGLVYALFTL